MKANWFIGIPVPADGWFDAVPPAPASSRRFGPADLHLTVAFLGAVDEEAARRAWEAISWTRARHVVSLGPIVPMGSPPRYSALSVLLGDGREEVEEEMSSARSVAWAAANVPPDERPPKAHITVARPRRKASDRERAEALAWANGIVLPNVGVELDTIALYTWADDRRTDLFRIVERSALPKRQARRRWRRSVEPARQYARRPSSYRPEAATPAALRERRPFAIAALGGHLKRNGDPGWQTLGRGYDKLREAAEIWALAVRVMRSDQS